MTPLSSRIQDILEEQQVDSVTAEDGQARILGIATTAEKIMEAVGGWKYGDPRCDSCDNGILPDWKWCPYCPAPQSSDDAEFGTSDFRRPDAAPAKKLVNPEKIKCAVQRELENWFGQALDDMDDEDRIRHHLLDPIVIAVAREIKALLEGN